MDVHFVQSTFVANFHLLSQTRSSMSPAGHLGHFVIQLRFTNISSVVSFLSDDNRLLLLFCVTHPAQWVETSTHLPPPPSLSLCGVFIHV